MIDAIQARPVTDPTGSGVVPVLRMLGGSEVVDTSTGNPIGSEACGDSTAEGAIALRSDEVGITVETCRAMGPTRSGPRSATSILSSAAAPGTRITRPGNPIAAIAMDAMGQTKTATRIVR
jgi:hypothetical protein